MGTAGAGEAACRLLGFVRSREDGVVTVLEGAPYGLGTLLDVAAPATAERCWIAKSRTRTRSRESLWDRSELRMSRAQTSSRMSFDFGFSQLPAVL